METPAVLFYVFAGLAVLSALAMVLNVRNTVAAAMSLVVTMVSIGVQSLSDAHLSALGRSHDAATGIEAVRCAVRHGFDTVNADLGGDRLCGGLIIPGHHNHGQT